MKNKLYAEDVKYTAELPLAWEKLANTRLLLAGASGLIGSFLTDVLMYQNRNFHLGCHILALGRNENQGRKRFFKYEGCPEFQYVSCDINRETEVKALTKVDYIIQAASNTHPVSYAEEPIETIQTNIIGTNHLLDYAVRSHARRFLFLSSVEVYGQNRGDTDKFREDYCGYIDANTLRAGYPEGKRAGETLCHAYFHKKNLDYTIARLARTYGPGMKMSDSKAVSQFIKRTVLQEDILLKSKGNQLYTYTYVADAAAGILTVLLEGKSTQAYNIAGNNGDITLKELAEFLAESFQVRVRFQHPDQREQQGYSKADKATLDGRKIQQLGYNQQYSVREGIQRTVQILRQIRAGEEQNHEVAE